MNRIIGCFFSTIGYAHRQQRHSKTQTVDRTVTWKQAGKVLYLQVASRRGASSRRLWLFCFVLFCFSLAPYFVLIDFFFFLFLILLLIFVYFFHLRSPSPAKKRYHDELISPYFLRQSLKTNNKQNQNRPALCSAQQNQNEN